jgi:3-oxo-5-alpha-steroid 4-dehydrogenase 3
MAVAVAIYGIGSVQQHKAHRHLASLKKYTLPHAGWFKHLVCAHYTAECLVYLGIAVGAAPDGWTLNGTLAAALLFVAVNLGTTGVGTKRWYADRFGADAVSRKRIMVPGIF